MNENQVLTWYRRAQIDYTAQYMALYASFNAWYREVTGSTNDREALVRICRGVSVWREYSQGQRMGDMVHYMSLLVEYTQREPLPFIARHWQGEVAHIYDWASTIEYWYRVRCLVMHGAAVRPTYVYLAYQTLNIFMREIIGDKA